MRNIKWRTFLCSQSELRLDITLRCGQSFRWKKVEDPAVGRDLGLGPVYIGVIQSKLLLLSQDAEQVFYHCVNNEKCDQTESLLKDYFQLSVNLSDLYTQWGESDPIFRKIAVDYPGVRILRQHPVENVFSFICSANNNIIRISSLVEKLCTHYGEFLCEFNEEKYSSFPEVASLSKPEVEGELRDLSFGYRAKYIQQSAKSILAQGGADWLLSLRSLPYEEAREAVTELPGVGPKVADCVLLMSLDQPGAVPIDTHMLTIAKKYLPDLRTQKTVTHKIYLEVSNFFRSLYGKYAGWAHSVLFSADLKRIQETVGVGGPSQTEEKQNKKKKYSKKPERSENVDSSDSETENTGKSRKKKKKT